MQQFFNFGTGKSVNPLEKLTHFFINPYMADNFKLLKLADRISSNEIPDEDIRVAPLKTGHVVTLFAVKHLIKGDVFIKWTEQHKFQIRTSSGTVIYCHIISKNFVRIDSII